MSAAPPSPARRLRRWLLRAAALACTALALAWAWQQPWALRARAGWELARQPPPTALRMPVQDADPRRVPNRHPRSEEHT
ncbi:membrane-bound metalloendopeptidase, partial [Xanthomonas translucens DAR61454]